MLFSLTDLSLLLIILILFFVPDYMMILLIADIPSLSAMDGRLTSFVITCLD